MSASVVPAAMNATSTLLIVCALLTAACDGEPHVPSGARVVVTAAAPASGAPGRPRCRPLGSILGVSASACGSGWTSKRVLVASAVEDLRGKAAALGANYVERGAPEFGWSGEFHGTSTSSAVVRGLAYRCADGIEAP
jgi:hypothetical protein